MTALPSMPVCIGWGAATALGPSARHTGFYLRAGKNNFTQSPFIDTFGEPVILAYATTLARDLVGPARLLELATSAISEALAPLGTALRDARIRLCLALPARYASGRGTALELEGRQLCETLRARAFAGVNLVDLHPLPFGGAAGAPALALASQLLHADEAEAVIVCGVDSYYDHAVLEQLEREDRLMTADNLDALRPGEAAACLLLVDPRSRLARGRGVAQVLRVGQGHEPTAGDPEQPSMARGFTDALRTAVAPLREQAVRCNAVYCDTTHERARVRELEILIARFGDVLGFDVALHTPARELGEVGAAALALHAVLATEAWFRGYGADSHAICFAGSDHGLRGALLLGQMQPTTRER